MRLLPFFLFAILVIFLAVGLNLNPRLLPSAREGDVLPDFSLLSLENDEKIDKSQLPEGVKLINVWATWCKACEFEHHFLMTLAKKGVPIIGVNYKDHRLKAKEWLKNKGNPYQVTLVDDDGRYAIELGVYGTPETFLVDHLGRIRYRHVGPLDEVGWHELGAAYAKVFKEGG